jgi:hypothetical protein
MMNISFFLLAGPATSVAKRQTKLCSSWLCQLPVVSAK